MKWRHRTVKYWPQIHMVSVLVGVFIAVTEHYDQNYLGKGFILHIHPYHSLSSWQELKRQKPAADVEAVEECCLWACSFLACSGFFLIAPQEYQPRDGTTCNELGLPHLLLIKKTHFRLAYRQTLWRHFFF